MHSRKSFCPIKLRTEKIFPSALILYPILFSKSPFSIEMTYKIQYDNMLIKVLIFNELFKEIHFGGV